LALRRRVGVESVVLDLGVERRDTAVQCDGFPEELVRLAGGLGLGLELSQYPPMDTSEPDSAKGRHRRGSPDER
jgi:hypothetical protein